MTVHSFFFFVNFLITRRNLPVYQVSLRIVFFYCNVLSLLTACKLKYLIYPIHSQLLIYNSGQPMGEKYVRLFIFISCQYVGRGSKQVDNRKEFIPVMARRMRLLKPNGILRFTTFAERAFKRLSKLIYRRDARTKKTSARCAVYILFFCDLVLVLKLSILSKFAKEDYSF